MAELVQVPELITTSRLELRIPKVGDTAAVTRLVVESQAELRPWLPWSEGNYTAAGAEASIRQAIADFVTLRDFRYHVFGRAGGQLVGATGLHRVRWDVPRFEIGYWVATEFAGRGYTTEAVWALTRVAFEELGAKRVEIRCDDRNLASSAVAEKCGYELEGILRNFEPGPDGTLRNMRIYARTGYEPEVE